ncbi:MAG TPA: acetyl-CoA acetyltransferase [Candidatus Limnocylindria bacterium]|nr:acetyl-CoA acetyltransferase [Candidatus Limnocylindria bacterium]
MSRDAGRMRGRVAIVGAGEADEHGRLPHKSAFQLHAEAARNALADAGLAKEDVDAVFSAGLWMGSETAEYLGIRPRYIDGTQIGGCSFIAHVQHAMAAIAAGVCEVALITHGESGASRIGMPGTRFGPDSWRLQFEHPFGLAGPPTGYALAAARHMHEFGTTSEQLAEVAVATRRWAELNPRALMRDPLTVGDVLASRLISWPLHLLDCCLVTDAGGAVVVTSAERARDCPKRPVYVLGTGEASTHVMVSQMPDFARWEAARMAGERAFAMAGVTRAEIDVAQIYDAFTIVPIMALEALGFCKEGEGGAFVCGGRTAPGGAFPMNTNGGGLSYTHPGMYGMFLVVEAVRQLRGECGPRQVDGVEIAVAHGSGMVLSCMSTAVLGTEAAL